LVKYTRGAELLCLSDFGCQSLAHSFVYID
jgi:hypothetical protein